MTEEEKVRGALRVSDLIQTYQQETSELKTENKRLKDCFVSLIEIMQKHESQIASDIDESEWGRGYNKGFESAVEEMIKTIGKLKTGEMPSNLRRENERLKAKLQSVAYALRTAIGDLA